MDSVKLDKNILLSVSKPGRYIGGEVNAWRKDFGAASVRVCLCFPDTYEIGMSHLGLRILYDLINRQTDYLAERVFSPWMDMEEKMREAGWPLFSLESRRPVGDFDVLGFSLTYELSYSNMLALLSLAGIPARASQRDDDAPLVIAGGACALNPEPIAPFVDAVVVGEAEEAMLEILERVRQHKARAASHGLSRPRKADLLADLMKIDGVYIPSFYDVQADGVRKAIVAQAPPRVIKRFVKDLKQVLDIERWVVPYINIVHDRLAVEILRGCPGRCRFCQARSAFYPLRLIDKETILTAVRRLYRATGYEEISLLSLSSSDHPDLPELVQTLAAELGPCGVSLSLPSLRARTIVGTLSKTFASMRKTTLTFAPEAGSERLRKMIRKDLSVEELFSVARAAYESGYRQLKLYFMIGLPTETDADLAEIHRLCQRLADIRREVDGHRAHLNVSVSNFIPKPHTPLQWVAMDSPQILVEKQNFLRKIFHSSRSHMKLLFHDARMSLVEGVLSRGDRRLADVIEQVHRSGARFDAWSKEFNPDRWQQAFDSCGVDARAYLSARTCEQVLPWDFIDVGIPCEALKKEFHESCACVSDGA